MLNMWTLHIPLAVLLLAFYLQISESYKCVCIKEADVFMTSSKLQTSIESEPLPKDTCYPHYPDSSILPLLTIKRKSSIGYVTNSSKVIITTCEDETDHISVSKRFTWWWCHTYRCRECHRSNLCHECYGCNNHDNVKVDGGYTEWGTWSQCTQSCDSGVRYRLRSCTNPVPQNGGDSCTGYPYWVESCNTQTCTKPTNPTTARPVPRVKTTKVSVTSTYIPKWITVKNP